MSEFFTSRLLSTFCLIYTLSICVVNAQSESTAFTATGRGGVSTTFATDYQSIGINPANLGFHKSFRDPKFTFGFLEMNATFFSEALTRKELFQTLFNSGDIAFTRDQKREAAERIANTSVSMNADVMLLGMSLQLPNNQGIAFSVRDRIQMYSQINRNTAEIAFLGATASYFPELLLSDGSVIANPRYPGNESLEPLTEEKEEEVILGLYSNEDSASFYSEIMDGSRVASTWFRELNFSYGKQLVDSYNFSMYAGIGLRYIMGITMIEMESQNNQLIASNISVSEDFGLDFGDDDDIVSSPTFRPPSDVSAFKRVAMPRPVGKGLGVDFGLTMVIKRNLYIGLAVTNIGNIKWDGNVYKVNDGKLVQFAGAGLNNFNILASDQSALQFAGDKSPLSWEGSNSIKQTLPSVIRVGASYEYHRTFHVGFDIIAPRNNAAGNLENILYAIGGDFRPNRIFKISTGANFGGNNQSKINIPVGFTYIARKGFYEAGIATRDITTYLANFGGGSTISFASGFLRFKL
ncbi:MAG: hypothetical protein CMO01_29825 [Thalassobius sp.]|nr:hypothetical protein [Thalassovita sp.]